MEKNAFHVSMDKNPLITMKVIPGHFTTSNAHITHYLDVCGLKSNAPVAREVAREMAIPYLTSALVETIVCLENTEVIGAYLAEELIQAGVSVVNEDGEIHVVTPIRNNVGHLSFQSSTIPQITNKNILLLTATISSGNSLNSALDCIAYYRGRVMGISALFMALIYDSQPPVNALFTADDIPGYRLYNSRHCELCDAGQKLDALISSEGYTKI